MISSLSTASAASSTQCHVFEFFGQKYLISLFSNLTELLSHKPAIPLQPAVCGRRLEALLFAAAQKVPTKSLHQHL